MTNAVVKKMLQDGYNEIAYTDKYIMGFILNHVVYATVCDRHTVDNVTCLDRASRGAGYALRFKPRKDQKMLLMPNAKAVCSDKFFADMVADSKYNKGEIFEKLVTESYGQAWEKDNIPFTEAGDIEVDGIAYQIKFEAATFCTEKSLKNLSHRA